ncbi:hypothetical protein A9798_09065 [Edwardsiella hoshinae]|uniref:Uncharacterized protein n=1 Tax=Edwardsiella hoshinae TaxID=93378 RepID=A0ABN4SZX9_9GAMM|nr:hypothetical protein [Edwardsiella hoshinae]AOV97099.1 hypothetical protein A9798_09065 [Edwardsiella hoshinae]
MERLVDYLCQALTPTPLGMRRRLQRRTIRIDASAEVQLTLSQWRFANGVLLQQEYEAELAPADTAAQCPACLIRWRVLEDAGLTIQPREKTFHNRCQQDFWLKAAGRDGL